MLELILSRHPDALVRFGEEHLGRERLCRAATNPDIRIAKIVFSGLKVDMGNLVMAARSSDAVLELLWDMPTAPWERPVRLLKAIAAGCKRTRTLRRALEGLEGSH